MENLFMKFSDTWLNICKEAALNQELIARLRKARLNVLIADAIGPRGELLAELLEIPLVYTLCFYPGYTMEKYSGGLLVPPSYVPVILSGLGGQMTFIEREMEDFLQSSGDNGVVMFSLASMINNLTDKTANAIASALAQIPQKVRCSTSVVYTLSLRSLMNNFIEIHLIVGHPKTKAFITHGGANGIYEAIHHGVPMVGIPLFGEQHDNIAHMVAKGAAVQLDIRTLSSKDLLRALETVISNPLYKKNAMWLSTIHHDQLMKPLDRAVFWIEFVMRHKGAKHLRPLAHNLTWYQYHSLDIIGFLLAGVATVMFLVIKCCLLAYQMFVKMGMKKKRE
ncbi:UDP-glucuronosyltransferase 2B17-like [Perognathus longimembris pacificus]|uniref:UDP-glucuronosyltransferase 2B17-like n=1 Tax=Perognathus longimembris pacificus TaxID=214514 RepID=UPI002018D183|nr:UDP-glucuronosyltransferase 2B17-like [Perognathus longimembris pacificus]